MPVGSVERKHVAALHYALRDRPGMANPVLWVLSKMFSLADAWGLRPAGLNPCRTVRRYRIHYRERFLNREEYRRIGRMLCEADAKGSPWPPAVAAIRLLMLTGCRSKEIATLRWDDVDRTAGELRLRDPGRSRSQYTPGLPWADKASTMRLKIFPAVAWTSLSEPSATCCAITDE